MQAVMVETLNQSVGDISKFICTMKVDDTLFDKMELRMFEMDLKIYLLRQKYKLFSAFLNAAKKQFDISNIETFRKAYWDKDIDVFTSQLSEQAKRCAPQRDVNYLLSGHRN